MPDSTLVLTKDCKFEFTYSYPCCNAQALRFSTQIQPQGCTSKNHTIKVLSSPSKRSKHNDKQKAMDIILQHFTDVCEPYKYEIVNYTNGETEQHRKLTELINEERSLMTLVKEFTQDKNDRTNNGELSDEDEDEEASQGSTDEDEIEMGCN